MIDPFPKLAQLKKLYPDDIKRIEADELDSVMKEIVRLSHTEEFHDKEVDYIVWKNRDALSKLVSPKKPSFESGGSPAEAAPEAEPDFSAGKGITPGMAEKAQTRSGSALEIRKGKS